MAHNKDPRIQKFKKEEAEAKEKAKVWFHDHKSDLANYRKNGQRSVVKNKKQKNRKGNDFKKRLIEEE